VRIVALVGDLMDRSRISAALPTATFTDDAAGIRDADVVVIDLTRYADTVEAVRAGTPGALIVAFAPHVDEDRLRSAEAAGADRVLPRSRFFRDPGAAVAPHPVA
jgi:DNA-binding NarL/FixJ family response regulator